MKSTTIDTSPFCKLAHRAAVLATTALGLLLGIPCAVNAQQYSLTTVDVPGATRTAANGNNNNVVAGEYDDADGNTHGFILRKGISTTIDVPGATSTALNGVNASGSFTGTYFKPDTGRIYAFVSRNGVVTTLDPAGSIQSQGGFINAQGEVVGGYRNSSGRRLAFYWRDGVFTTIDPAPAATLGPVAFGINDK